MLIPGTPLIPVLYLSQALNAVMLVPLLVFVVRLSNDPELMGALQQRRGARRGVGDDGVVALCVGALAATLAL